MATYTTVTLGQTHLHLSREINCLLISTKYALITSHFFRPLDRLGGHSSNNSSLAIHCHHFIPEEHGKSIKCQFVECLLAYLWNLLLCRRSACCLAAAALSLSLSLCAAA